MKRSKGSQDGAQPITGDELRAIKRYLAIRKSSLPWLFVSERGEQFTRQGIAYIIREAGNARQARSRVAAHAAPLLRLPPCQPEPGARPQAHPGLPRAQEHQEHRALHTHERAAVRGAVGLTRAPTRTQTRCAAPDDRRAQRQYSTRDSLSRIELLVGAGHAGLEVVEQGVHAVAKALQADDDADGDDGRRRRSSTTSPLVR